MDLLAIASPVVGFLGAIVQKGVGIYEERQRHRNEMEKLELASRIDVQKADLSLRQTQEDHSGAAFTEAIKAQAGLQAEGSRMRNAVVLFRPCLTTFTLLAAVGHATYLVLSEGADASEFWKGIHYLASMSYCYWFGVRQFSKTEVRLAAPIKK